MEDSCSWLPSRCHARLSLERQRVARRLAQGRRQAQPFQATAAIRQQIGQFPRMRLTGAGDDAAGQCREYRLQRAACRQWNRWGCRYRCGLDRRRRTGGAGCGVADRSRFSRQGLAQCRRRPGGPGMAEPLAQGWLHHRRLRWPADWCSGLRRR